MDNRKILIENWEAEYKRKGALWVHDGNPVRPHALLTSGKHSNGFFNSRLVIESEELLSMAARDLVTKLLRIDSYVIDSLDCVVGPATGATKLAMLIARDINSYFPPDHWRFWYSPKKGETENGRIMVFQENMHPYRYDEVLLCDDVLTTGGSLKLTENAVERDSAFVLPFVLVLVNRSGFKSVNGKRIISLVDREMPIWKKDECPLCKNGSKAIRPKDNWELLNAEY